jgi:thiamine pyrophosphokinase
MDKDETDTELALLEAVRRGATRITLLGAVGGPRVDHELANVLLLAREELAGVPVAILDPRARISLVDARGRTIERQLPGALGAPISLLSIGSPGPRVRTSGLRYPLHDERLALGPARGVSNVRTEPDASIRVRDGRLLIVETPVSLGS